MQRYILSYNCGFKIGLYGYRQVDVNTSEFNTDVLVSPLLNGNQNGVENQSLTIKLKLKTLICLLTYLIHNNNIIIDNHYINMLYLSHNKCLLYGNLDNFVLNNLNYLLLNNKPISIVIYNIYKIIYNTVLDKINFKYIFTNTKVKKSKYSKYKILLSTQNCFDIVISYKTLKLLVSKKFKDNNININNILKNDIFFSEIYNKYNITEKHTNY
jgi:hypothetical protein